MANTQTIQEISDELWLAAYREASERAAERGDSAEWMRMGAHYHAAANAITDRTGIDPRPSL